MGLPQTLQNYINEANKEINNHPNGELILPIRKKIWLEFGTIQQNSVPTIGTIRRTLLEIINLERLIHLWEEVLPSDNRPQIILEEVRNYLNGKTGRDILKRLFNSSCCSKEEAERWKEQYKEYDLWVACENHISEEDIVDRQLAYIIGFCACKIRNLALKDTDLSRLDKLDLDYDSYDTYVSYDISNIVAPFTWSNVTNETISKRRNYWLWYINDAIPEAYHKVL